MKLSIIVPVYNVKEEYLIRCLNSLMEQELEDIEIIVIDDGSTDNSSIICDGFGAKDNRFKIIHKENSGVSDTRNLGISLSSGEYISFVDADDFLIQNDLCSRLYQTASQHDVDILLFKHRKKSECGCNETKTDGNTEEYTAERDIVGLRCNVISYADVQSEYLTGAPWGKLIKRKFIEDNGFHFNTALSHSEDRVFILECLYSTDRVGKVGIVGYEYNDTNESSLSRKKNKNLVATLERSDQEIFKVLRQPLDTRTEQAVYIMRITNFFKILFDCILVGDDIRIKSSVNEIKKLLNKEMYSTAFRKVGKEERDDFAKRKKIRPFKIFLIRHHMVFLCVVETFLIRKVHKLV